VVSVAPVAEDNYNSTIGRILEYFKRDTLVPTHHMALFSTILIMAAAARYKAVSIRIIAWTIARRIRRLVIGRREIHCRRCVKPATSSPCRTVADTGDASAGIEGWVFDSSSRMCSRHAPCRTGVNAGETEDGSDVRGVRISRHVV
jgi:hypothetical protein